MTMKTIGLGCTYKILLCRSDTGPYCFSCSFGKYNKFLPAATKLWPRLCFTRVCDSVNRGGGMSEAAPRSRHPPGSRPPYPPGPDPPGTRPPGADTPPGPDPPGTRPSGSRHPPGTRHHPRLGTRHPPRADPPKADSSIQSTSGRYASYWNAFLSSLMISFVFSCFKQVLMGYFYMRNRDKFP